MIFGILDYIKLGAGAVLGFMLAVAGYEGVPLVKDIPYISYVPLIGDLAIGRVQVKVNAAVSAAQHGFAVQSEMAAVKAQAAAQAESQRQAAIVASEYANRLAASNLANDQKDKELDDALAANEKLRAAAGIKSPPLDNGTADLLRKHGFEVDQ
jgi:hypothetical protein